MLLCEEPCKLFRYPLCIFVAPLVSSTQLMLCCWCLGDWISSVLSFCLSYAFLSLRTLWRHAASQSWTEFFSRLNSRLRLPAECISGLLCVIYQTVMGWSRIVVRLHVWFTWKLKASIFEVILVEWFFFVVVVWVWGGFFFSLFRFFFYFYILRLVFKQRRCLPMSLKALT